MFCIVHHVTLSRRFNASSNAQCKKSATLLNDSQKKQFAPPLAVGKKKKLPLLAIFWRRERRLAEKAAQAFAQRCGSNKKAVVADKESKEV